MSKVKNPSVNQALASWITSKLVRDPTNTQTFNKNQLFGMEPNSGYLTALSGDTAMTQRDIENILEMLPDTELIMIIIVSSILSPKDMGTPTLNFKLNGMNSDDEKIGKMLDIVREFCVKRYKINSKLPDIVTKIMFKQGSYVTAVIPESEMDRLIRGNNLTMESVRTNFRSTDGGMIPNNIGVLKPPVKDKADGDSLESTFSLESAFGESSPSKESDVIFDYIHIVDNPDTLKVNDLMSKISTESANRAIDSYYEISLEARRTKQHREESNKMGSKGKTVDDRSIYDDHFNEAADPDVNSALEVDVPSDPGEGMAYVRELNPNCVVPMVESGNPDKHLGAWVIVDQFGNPLNLNDAGRHQDIIRRYSTQDETSSLLNELAGGNATQSADLRQDVSEMTRLFGERVNRELISRLRDGNQSIEMDTSEHMRMYSVMLSRALRRRQTQLLFIPEKLLSYMAFEYADTGVGVSYIAKSRNLASIRIILQFAETMAATKNSIPRTKLSIEMDPTDPSPINTAMQVRDTYVEMRNDNFPWGRTDARVGADMANSGIEMVIKGHPALPQMNVDAEESNSNIPVPNSDLSERYRKLYAMTLGLSPSNVDIENGAELATAIVNESLMLNKRVVMWQGLLEKGLNKLVRMLVRYSGVVRQSLMETLGGSKIKGYDSQEEFLDDFINSISVELPRPDTVTVEKQMEALEEHSNYIDSVLDFYLSEDMLEADLTGQLGDSHRALRAAMKAHLMRRYIRDNNILPELDEMFTDIENHTFSESHREFMDKLGSQFEDFFKDLKEAKDKREEFIKEALGESGNSDSGGFGSSGYGSSGGGSGFGGGSFGSGSDDNGGSSGDFGGGFGGDDFGGDFGGDGDNPDSLGNEGGDPSGSAPTEDTGLGEPETADDVPVDDGDEVPAEEATAGGDEVGDPESTETDGETGDEEAGEPDEVEDDAVPEEDSDGDADAGEGTGEDGDTDDELEDPENPENSGN